MNNSLDIKRVTGRIGAEIGGVKLSPDLDRDTVAAIRAALLKHKVIFFREQTHLDHAGQEGFAELLGEPVPHPTVPTYPGTKYSLSISSIHGGRTNSWHTDVTFVHAYPEASILRAETIPSAGGDTMWANTVTALDDLSPELHELATKLWALHTNDYDYRWTPGDVAIWDNRATQHYGVNDYGDELRSLQRVTIAGDVPVSVDGRPSIARKGPGIGPAAVEKAA